MQFLIFLLLVAAVCVVPMAALFYGFQALRWGARNHPKATTVAVVFLIGLVLTAAMTIGRVFPGCYMQRGTGITFGECGYRPPHAG